MIADMLKISVIFSVLVLSHAGILPPGGTSDFGIASPAGDDTIASSIDNPNLGDIVLLDTSLLGIRVDLLNETVLDLKKKAGHESSCDCSATEKTTANAAEIATLSRSVSTLDATCTEQRTSLEDMTSTVGQVSAVSDQDFSGEVDEIQGKISDIGSMFSDFDSKLLTLASGVDAITLDDVSSTADRLNDALANLAREVSSCTAQCSSAAASVGSSGSAEEHKELTEYVSGFNDRMDDVEAQSQGLALVLDLDNLAGRVTLEEGTSMGHDSELYDDMFPRTTEIDTAVLSNQGALDGEEDRLQNLETNMAEQTAVDAVSENLADLQTKLREASTATNTGGASILTLEARVYSAEVDVNYYKQEVDAHVVTQEALPAEVQAMEERVSTADEYVTNAELSYNSQLATIEQSVGQLQEKLQNLENEGMDSQTALDTVSTSVTDLASKLEDLSGPSDGYGDDVVTLRESAEGAYNSLSNYDFTEEIQNAEADIDIVFDDVDYLQDKIKTSCPYPYTSDWVGDQQICYRLVWQYLTWDEANIYCQALGGKTGRLVVLENEEKRLKFMNVVWSYPYNSFYIGLFTMDKWTKTFSWIGGQTDFDSTWNPGEPASWDYMCGTLWDSDWYGHKLDDVYCDSALPFICEIPQ